MKRMPREKTSQGARTLGKTRRASGSRWAERGQGALQQPKPTMSTWRQRCTAQRERSDARMKVTRVQDNQGARILGKTWREKRSSEEEITG